MTEAHMSVCLTDDTYGFKRYNIHFESMYFYTRSTSVSRRTTTKEKDEREDNESQARNITDVLT